jgi:demethylmenaquinone methyltransferase/2-methoxy-6-polyprenyl-1,4-benzoquinol methylase
MVSSENSEKVEPPTSTRLRNKYAVTGWLYDILDYPWERQYRHWRPEIVGDVSGDVLEAGVGTGRNLRYYCPEAQVLGVDLSPVMLRQARRRAKQASCGVVLRQDDATQLSSIADESVDWVVSTFMCCVMPDEVQALSLEQFARVLKPGGRFRLVEMVWSEDPRLRRRQERFAPFVEWVYGARFDRQTLSHIREVPELEVLATRFLKADTYLLIEGRKRR